MKNFRIYSAILMATLLLPLAAISQNKNELTNSTNIGGVKYKDFRIALGGGYAHRLGKIMKIDSDIDKLSRDLRSGYNIDLDGQYFFKETWGLGLSLNYAASSVSANNIHIPGMGGADKFKETNSFVYFGPTFSARHEFNNFLLLAHIGVGPLLYHVKDDLDGRDYTLSKVVFGAQTSVSLEYNVSDQIGLGLKASIIGGSIKLDGMDGRMNVSNLSIGAYISFKTWK